MKYNLFLDDIRMPQQASFYMPSHVRDLYRTQEWVIVRNYDEFVACIQERGMPYMVSFDHDLAEAHYDPSTWTESFQYLDKTGYDCAKWMVEHMNENHLPLPLVLVHSMNPVGKQNIINFLNEASNTG
jgi:hypothetical protein